MKNRIQIYSYVITKTNDYYYYININEAPHHTINIEEYVMVNSSVYSGKKRNSKKTNINQIYLLQ